MEEQPITRHWQLFIWGLYLTTEELRTLDQQLEARSGLNISYGVHDFRYVYFQTHEQAEAAELLVHQAGRASTRLQEGEYAVSTLVPFRREERGA